MIPDLVTILVPLALTVAYATSVHLHRRREDREWQEHAETAMQLANGRRR